MEKLFPKRRLQKTVAGLVALVAAHVALASPASALVVRESTMSMARAIESPGTFGRGGIGRFSGGVLQEGDIEYFFLDDGTAAPPRLSLSSIQLVTTGDIVFPFGLRHGGTTYKVPLDASKACVAASFIRHGGSIIYTIPSVSIPSFEVEKLGLIDLGGSFVHQAFGVDDQSPLVSFAEGLDLQFPRRSAPASDEQRQVILAMTQSSAEFEQQRLLPLVIESVQQQLDIVQQELRNLAEDYTVERQFLVGRGESDAEIAELEAAYRASLSEWQNERAILEQYLADPIAFQQREWDSFRARQDRSFQQGVALLDAWYAEERNALVQKNGSDEEVKRLEERYQELAADLRAERAAWEQSVYQPFRLQAPGGNDSYLITDVHTTYEAYLAPRNETIEGPVVDMAGLPYVYYYSIMPDGSLFINSVRNIAFATRSDDPDERQHYEYIQFFHNLALLRTMKKNYEADFAGVVASVCGP